VCLLLIDNILFGDICWQAIAENVPSQNILSINKIWDCYIRRIIAPTFQGTDPSFPK